MSRNGSWGFAMAREVREGSRELPRVSAAERAEAVAVAAAVEPAPRCDAIVRSSSQCLPRQCNRPARWSSMLRNGRTVRECSQHNRRDRGVWRMLAPAPWEVLSEVELPGRPNGLGRKS